MTSNLTKLPDWSIFKDRVWCINLKSRVDRFDSTNLECKRVGLFPYLQYHHVDRNLVSSVLGCFTSHIEVLRKAKKALQPFVLVLEDDIYFENDIVVRHLPKITTYLESIAGRDDWDILYLGHFPFGGGGIVQSQGEFKVYNTKSYYGHCYVANLHSPSIQELIAKPLPVVDYKVLGSSMLHIDHIYMTTMATTRAIYPMLCYQIEEMSSDNNWGNFLELLRSNRAILDQYEMLAISNTHPAIEYPTILSLAYVARKLLNLTPK